MLGSFGGDTKVVKDNTYEKVDHEHCDQDHEG